jgi:DNA-binding LytR/AlgR family response regulator
MIHCFVVDDEAHAMEVLTRYIRKTPGLELAGAEENPLVALDHITNSQVAPGIAFVDVDMPQLSGMDLAELIPAGTEVIFTTAFPDYALQAFEKNAMDYLLKPITYERFLKAVGKVKEKLALKTCTAGKQEEADYIFVKGDMKGKVVRILLADILYIEALQNYIKIYTTKGLHVTYLTMKEIAAALPSCTFVRVHKSFIVNTRQVKAVEGNLIVLVNEKMISVGANYRPGFMERINAKLVKSGRLP